MYYKKLIYSYCCTVFSCLDIPQFIPSLLDGYSGFLVLAVTMHSAIDIICVICQNMHVFLLGYIYKCNC